MAKRKIIEIDRDKCDGCGLCTEACAEGALILDEENKAKLVREIYCDGLGACLDVCPTGALTITDRESAGYNAEATYAHVLKTRGKNAAAQVHGAADLRKPEPGTAAANPHRTGFPMGCPGSRARAIERGPSPGTAALQAAPPSELSQWPIQLHLISPHAPYFDRSDLLIAADCTAFSLGGFHPDLLREKKLVIACPKLDDTRPYVDKLAELLRTNTLYSLTVARMVVPCCSGLTHIVREAAEKSGSGVKIKEVVIGIDGAIVA
jgi:ferredoxin